MGFNTHGEDGADVDEGPARAVEWPVRNPGPGKSKDDEDAGGNEWYYSGEEILAKLDRSVSGGLSETHGC
jgi:hypothetical protein